MKRNRLSFVEFLHKIYSMDLGQYRSLNEYQQKAVDIDYRNRYGIWPVK